MSKIHFDGLSVCPHCGGDGDVCDDNRRVVCPHCAGTGICGDRAHPFFDWAYAFLLLRGREPYALLRLNLARMYFDAGFPSAEQAIRAWRLSWHPSKGVASEAEMLRALYAAPHTPRPEAPPDDDEPLYVRYQRETAEAIRCRREDQGPSFVEAALARAPTPVQLLPPLATGPGRWD